jgi:magnesium-transporting ATPase (P-type)
MHGQRNIKIIIIAVISMIIITEVNDNREGVRSSLDFGGKFSFIYHMVCSNMCTLALTESDLHHFPRYG